MMVTDPRRRPLLALATQLLFHLAAADPESFTGPLSCADFHPASLLSGSKLHIQFLLFTSSHPSCGQLLSSIEDIRNSSFDPKLGTRIIIHGFRPLGNKPSWINRLVGALLKAAPANVVAVDWIHGATANYNSAVENVTKLALEISAFIQRLRALGVQEASIHLIGVSLGAHVAGLVGHFHSGRLARITGLDPAGPKYTKASKEERLDPEDAVFVEAIHMDADKFGIGIPVGHIDYYVNGGDDQPGCSSSITAAYKSMICDHVRVVPYYISVLEDSCPSMAFPCSSYQDFLAGHCVYCTDSSLPSCPTLGLMDNGGLDMKPLPREVKVYLATAAYAPFCVHHSLVKVYLKQLRTSDTAIEISFWGRNATFRITVTVPKLQTMGKNLAIHSTPLHETEKVTFLYHSKSWRRSKDDDPVISQFCVAPLPLDPGEAMFCMPETTILTGKTSPFYDFGVLYETTTVPLEDAETMTGP